MIKKKQILYIFFLLIILFHLNLFQNFYDILIKNYEDRMIKTYGDHDNQGYGFIKKVKSKYKLKGNFIYYNYDMPEPHWLIDLNPKYIYNLKNIQILSTNQNREYNYMVIIDEPYDEINFFLKENNFKIILSKDNSYLISLL